MLDRQGRTRLLERPYRKISRDMSHDLKFAILTRVGHEEGQEGIAKSMVISKSD